jgi:hypothetical protein
MLLPIFNPIPFLLTLCTAFGVLLHDTQLDHAAIAVSPGVTDSNYYQNTFKQNDLHTHIERVNFSNNFSSLKFDQPRVQPRDEDDDKYATQKKSSDTTFGSVYSWPSV